MRESRRLREEELQVPTEILAPRIRDLNDVADYTADKPVPEPSTERQIDPSESDEHIKGDRNAPYSIIEYTSYDDDYAALLHSYIDEFVNENTDVNWIYRHMLRNDGLSLESALVGECVYLQGGDAMFWAFTDTIMNRQQLYTSDVLYQAVETAGASRDQVEACVRNEETVNPVVRDAQDAALDARLNVSPSFFIKNNTTGELRLIEGVNTMEYFDKVLSVMRASS